MLLVSTQLKRLQTKCRQVHQLVFGDRTAKQFPDWKHYFSPQPIAGYIGFLGHQNLGDEILYSSFQQLFPALQFLPYDGASDPVHNPPFNYYPLELALYRRLVKPDQFYDIVFLGGGTLINHQHYLSRWQHALQHNSHCVVFGTGVGEPQFWHDRDPHENYLQQIQDWIPLLAEATAIVVRGPRSAEILQAHGLARPTYISDPALSICQPRPIPTARNGTIALNIGSHGILWGNQAHVYDVIKEFVRQLIKLGWHVELLPFQGNDLRLSDRLLGELNLPQLSIWRNFTQYDQLLRRMQNYDLVVGQRLHAIVLACGCGIPFISLSYAPKCEDFLASIDGLPFAVRTDQIEVDRVLELVNSIDRHYEPHCQQLIDIGNHYRRLQHQMAQAITHLTLK